MNREEKIQELLKTNHLFYDNDFFSKDNSLLQATKDFDLITKYLQQYDKKTGPRMGDILKVSSDTSVRFERRHGKAIKTGTAAYGYFLHGDYADYSGGLDPELPIAFFEIHPFENTREAPIRFFSDGQVGAHRSVCLTVPFPVFRIKQDAVTIHKISTLVKHDKFPFDHPLRVLESDSPQFKTTLTEYYFYRNSLNFSRHPLLKNCIIHR